VKVTAEAARRFLVARHFLAPARSVPGGLDGVLRFAGAGRLGWPPHLATEKRLFLARP